MKKIKMIKDEYISNTDYLYGVRNFWEEIDDESKGYAAELARKMQRDKRLSDTSKKLAGNILVKYRRDFLNK